MLKLKQLLGNRIDVSRPLPVHALPFQFYLLCLSGTAVEFAALCFVATLVFVMCCMVQCCDVFLR